MKRNTETRQKRTRQYNGKVTWQSLESLNSAIGEATGFEGTRPEALDEAVELMKRARAILVEVGRANDSAAETDFFTDEALDYAAIGR